MIYTNNAIESVNARSRKGDQNARAFPNDEGSDETDLAGATTHHQPMGDAGVHWKAAMVLFAISSAIASRTCGVKSGSRQSAFNRLAHKIQDTPA